MNIGRTAPVYKAKFKLMPWLRPGQSPYRDVPSPCCSAAGYTTGVMHNSIELIDCHVHLQDAAFAGDWHGVLARASAAGVRRFVCNGTCEADWPGVAKLARLQREIVPCFGLHPWYVGTRSANWISVLESYIDSMPSAVGEVGLDRWVEPRDEPAQEEVFRAQLAIARQRNRPVMIHCLRAWGWLLDVLRDELPLTAGMLIHAYGGSVELIKTLADRGAYFSFAGNVFQEQKSRARAALAAVPLDRLLIETDGPDMLPPTPYRLHVLRGPDGKEHNEPANLRAILRGVAQIRGMPEEDLARTLWENARRLLKALVE